MTSPLVSIVTGVHNGGRYLAGSLDSVLGQAGVHFELIVVNDGSTDDTGPVLAQYAARDDRVLIIEQPHSGLTRALIAGCAAARGTFIARHDADDISLPGRLSAQASALTEGSGLAMVSCWAECVGPRDEVLYALSPTLSAPQATKALLEGLHGPPGHGSVMFRRDAYEQVGGYRDEFYYAQDADLWRRLADEGGLGYVHRLLYRFRVRASSISTSRSQLQERFNQLAHACSAARRRGLPESPYLDEARELAAGMSSDVPAESDSAAYFIGRCLLARRDPRARRYLTAALRESPGRLRAWASFLEAMLVR